MTYIITMETGRRYKVEDYDSVKYRGGWMKFYNAGGNTIDRFREDNIEHIDVRERGRAEYIGRVNSNQ